MTTTAIRDRLQAIADASGGRLTPDDVIADARDPSSPLHGSFDWNDESAAGQWRVEQARRLIRGVRIMVRTERTIVRAPYFLRDPSAESQQGYVATTTLRKEEDLAREVVLNEFARAAHILRRARNVAVALDLANDIDALIDGIFDLSNRLRFVADGEALRA